MRFVPPFNKWVSLFAVLIVLFILSVETRTIDAWRSYYPLPPIPARSRPMFSVSDKGATTARYVRNLYTRDLALRDDGTMREIRDTDFEPSDSARKRFQTRWPRATGEPDTRVLSIASNGNGLSFDSHFDSYTRYAGGAQTTVPHYKRLRGYNRWPFYRDARFLQINMQGDVIGNDLFETGRHSCTHVSYSHGRRVPLLWRANRREIEDVNTLIAENTGWYIEQALYLNDRGQILCLARRTDAKGAGTYNTPPRHLVVLTPFSIAR